MPERTISMQFEFKKPLQDVFAELSDHTRFGEIIGCKMTRLKEGSDSVNGTNSVRRISVGPMPAFEETITAFKPNEFIEYKITKGSPLKNHVGSMQFVETNMGCSLSYDISFDSRLPLAGAPISFILKEVISRGLIRYATQAS